MRGGIRGALAAWLTLPSVALLTGFAFGFTHLTDAASLHSLRGLKLAAVAVAGTALRVNEINRGDAPWLRTKDSIDNASIHIMAGTTLQSFVEQVELAGVLWLRRVASRQAMR